MDSVLELIVRIVFDVLLKFSGGRWSDSCFVHHTPRFFDVDLDAKPLDHVHVT